MVLLESSFRNVLNKYVIKLFKMCYEQSHILQEAHIHSVGFTSPSKSLQERTCP